MNCQKLTTFVITICCSLCMSANVPLRARFLSSDNGLGTNYARAIVQDPKGYIWIGSTDGLIRYDGYNATLLKPSEAPNRRLMSDYRIQDMRMWKEQFLLIRVRNRKYGCYDINTDRFVEFKDDYEKAFSKETIDTSKLPSDIPKDAEIRLDNRGNIVALTMKGNIWHIDAKSKQVTRITGVYSEELVQLNGKPRYGIVTDKDGLIWISTYGNGLFIYDRKTGQKTHYLKNIGNVAPIQTNYLLSIYEDRGGNIWACQENMGVAIISKQTSNAETVFFDSPEDMGHVNSLHLLKRVGDVIYIGNRYNGLKVADSQLNTMHTATRYNDDVVVVRQGLDGTLWMGTRKSGIFNNARQYRHDNNNPTSISKGKISDILCDNKGRIWVSIFDGAVDMAEIDSVGEYRFRHFFTGNDAIESPRQMVTDHHGYIWLSSDNGFYVFHPDRLINNPKAYKHLHVDEHNLQLDAVHCFIEDSRHRILVGTQGSGLAIMDNSKPGEPLLKKVFTTKDGLPNNNIQQLIEDEDENVWIGTDHGLSRFDTKKNTFISFLTSDFLQGNMFVENAVCRLKGGRLAFGSRHGIVIIDPHRLPTSKRAFKPQITDIDINGVSIYQQEDSVLASKLTKMQELSFNYNQNSLTFHFSDFEYNEEQNSKYSYRLKGYDNEWSPLSATSFVTYKNLPSGNYTFELKVQGANEEVSEHAVSLPIVILPPLWLTWWAYLIYILVLAALGWFVWRYFKRTNDLQNRIKVETQLTEYKLRFFTNISHEFRTPLTIIRGAMERMAAIDDIPGDMKQPVSTMRKSVDRMMRLINELLEFRKMQNNKLQLALEETDVIGFIKEIYLTFHQTAENKHMSYTFLPFAHQYMMYIDKSFVDKIVYNLLSNSFKYTMARHSVTLRITHDEEAQTIGIMVEDTGIGVHKDKQADLFTRFNQSIYTQDSIGVGLHLVHELVRVHHGHIEFKENSGGGSIFTVTLPTDKNCYEEKDFLVEGNDLLREQNENRQPEPLTDYKEMAAEPLNDRRILIVEDDDGIRDYMVNELSHFFMIDTASNGQEALERLYAENSERPDLIVSDVLMPIMNGYELTRSVRTDKETADIPIILLTALTAEEKKIKGLDSGADAYVEKPFSMKVLVAKCRQLMSQRDQLRLKYAKEVVGRVEVPEVLVDEQDKKLRDLLDTWLSAHISDSNLSIDQFAEKMGYGRTTFYKKVKKLTGQTPNDYIKARRMERAIELLKDDTLTVAEVSYKIGIEDPFYFSKSFKSYFGISPSQYRKGEKPKQK